MPASAPPATFFVTFVSGLTTTSVAGTMEGDMVSVVIPATIQGQSYAFITNQNVTAGIMDSMILFGPAVLEVTPPSPMFDLSESK